MKACKISCSFVQPSQMNFKMTVNPMHLPFISWQFASISVNSLNHYVITCCLHLFLKWASNDKYRYRSLSTLEHDLKVLLSLGQLTGQLMLSLWQVNYQTIVSLRSIVEWNDAWNTMTPNYVGLMSSRQICQKYHEMRMKGYNTIYEDMYIISLLYYCTFINWSYGRVTTTLHCVVRETFVSGGPIKSPLVCHWKINHAVLPTKTKFIIR